MNLTESKETITMTTDVLQFVITNAIDGALKK